MKSKKGQGKGQNKCRQYGEYQWMMGEMGAQDAKGGKDKQKDQGKNKQKNCRCQGYYYECMEKGQKCRSKNKDKNKGK